MTYQNIGYWIGQANDVSGGAHPTGWTSGQRWSETAGEWQTMYGTSQGDLSAMTANRDYWKTTVAHDDPAVWDNRYNAGYAAADVAESPRALSTYNFTGTATANGSLNPVTIVGAGAGGVLTNSGTSLVAVRPGYWMIAAKVNGYNNTGVKIFTEGAERAVENGTPNAPDFLAGVSTWWVGFINASGSISFQGRANTICNLAMTVTFVPSPGYQQ